MEFSCFNVKPQMWIMSTPAQVNILKILRFDSQNKRPCCTWISHWLQWEFRTRSNTKYRFGCNRYLDRVERSLHLTSSAPCTRWCSLGTAATLVSIYISLLRKILAELFIVITECQIFIWFKNSLKLLKSVQSSWFKFILNRKHKRLHSDLAPALILLCNAVELFLISIYVKI